MTQTTSIFLSLSIALLAGLLLSRLAKLVKLPAVTAYLISGVLIGPFVLGALGIPGIGITSKQIEGFGLISDLALGFIAFSMGNEFRLSQLKKIGKQATVIGVLQALITTVVVDVALIALHFAMPDTLSIPVIHETNTSLTQLRAEQATSLEGREPTSQVPGARAEPKPAPGSFRRAASPGTSGRRLCPHAGVSENVRLGTELSSHPAWGVFALEQS